MKPISIDLFQNYHMAGNFCGFAVLREIHQYFYPSNCSQYDVIITDTLLCDVINMWSTVVRSAKEWNENSPYLVYHLQNAPLECVYCANEASN